MHNARPFSSWSLSSHREIRNIQRKAEEMRAEYIKGLVRRLFAGNNSGRLSEQGA